MKVAGIEDSDDHNWSDLLLLQLYTKVEVGETLSVDTVTAYLKKKFPKANAERILGVESEYDYKRQVWEWNISLLFFFLFISYP